MTYTPTAEQQDVIASEDPVLLVLGGAGTGKTTTAAAAVRSTLDRLDALQTATGNRRAAPPPRSLFLSFSRASVARILDRTASDLEPVRNRVEITTFHAFAWRMLKRWGSAVGVHEPLLLSEAEAKLFSVPGSIRYRHLVPLALELCSVRPIREHLESRWALLVVDEFQDTDEDQFELVLRIRGAARLLLLGDPNQCIYKSLPDVRGVGPERLSAALALAGVRRVDFPEASHRDPSNVLPAAAGAIRRREFKHPAVFEALVSGRLKVRSGLPMEMEADAVAEVISHLSADGSEVAVFSHHIDATASLSDRLAQFGINHEIVGLAESLAAAFDAQHTMVQFAVGNESWDSVRSRLAVFVASCVRGNAVPDLARVLLGSRPITPQLQQTLEDLQADLVSAGGMEAMQQAQAAHARIGLPNGRSNWDEAARLLRPVIARFFYLRRSYADPSVSLREVVQERRVDLLTYSTLDGKRPVQLMGLYQSKGREADATVVVLRASDFFGHEDEPFEEGSRLLYVVLTRARLKTVILVFGDPLPRLIAPLTGLREIDSGF